MRVDNQRSYLLIKPYGVDQVKTVTNSNTEKTVQCIHFDKSKFQRRFEIQDNIDLGYNQRLSLFSRITKFFTRPIGVDTIKKIDFFIVDQNRKLRSKPSNSKAILSSRKNFSFGTFIPRK